MTKKEIIDAICQHLDQDTRYKMSIEESSTNLGLKGTYTITFDLTNTAEGKHHAPYFKVESLSHAREIIKEVLEKENDFEAVPSFEEKFNAILSTKQFDISKPLFVCVFKEH
jgi:hypothetical protein